MSTGTGLKADSNSQSLLLKFSHLLFLLGGAESDSSSRRRLRFASPHRQRMSSVFTLQRAGKSRTSCCFHSLCNVVVITWLLFTPDRCDGGENADDVESYGRTSSIGSRIGRKRLRHQSRRKTNAQELQQQTTTGLEMSWKKNLKSMENLRCKIACISSSN